MLFLRRLNKWDEVIYADMFFTLRNKPEWQKECGINVAPQDPLVLALERDKKGPKSKDRCCDACSIGQQCLKLTRRDSGKESEISLWEYHPFAPGREGPLPRPKEEQGDPSPLKELEQWWKSKFGCSPQKLDNGWEEGSPSKSGISEGKGSPQELGSPQGSGSYVDSPPGLELEREEGSPSGVESRGETRSPPELSPYGDSNTSRNGGDCRMGTSTPRTGVCRMETSTPKAGDKSDSLGGDVPELKYSKGSGNVTCEKETENNSQRLNIIIQIEDKRDGKAAEDEKGGSPGQDKGRQVLGGRQTQDGSRTDCVIEIGGENEELDIEAQEEDPGARTSHSYYTRSVARGETKRREEGNHTIAPLRQIMPMVGEKTRVKVPFSTSDLNNWRDEAKNFRRNPEGVAKRFELMARNLDIDWEDIEVMLSELTDTERELVLETGRQHAQVLPGRIEDNFPSSKPEWDPGNADHYQRLVQYRKLIAMGLRNAIPKAINWSVLYNIRQGKDETPSEFLDRLRAAMRQYTPLDPATEEGKQHLLGLMMGQSNPDIRKKLQKLEHPANKNLETLLNEAWKVYNNREAEEKKREDRRIARVVAVAVAAQKTGHPEPGTRGRGRGNPMGRGGRLQPHPTRVGPNQCAHCLQMGHWRRECPQLRERFMATTTTTHQDSE